jgi:Carboxypeptidase regulatory-like domain/TonB-dependent Receptor Plug Domain
MKRTVLLFGCVWIFGVLLLSGKPAWGQAASGRVIGSITDQQGAVVPGAKVTVTNTATQLSSATTSGADGSFEVLNLPIGPYIVTVERDGFQKLVTSESRLDIGQSLRFDVALTLGTVSQTITVESQPSKVETVNPTVGGTITGEAIQQAPLNGRNVLDLAKLEPGVTETNPDNGSAGTYSIAGGRTDSVTFLLDGALNNNLLDNGVVFNPNPDTIAEFRVLESSYSAEYGRNSGGIISVVTKSGTNQWHGSAYDYLRNGDLNANSYFNNVVNGVVRDPLRRNQYGGSLGGPITIPHLINGKDRFFFFVGYQGQKQSDQATPPFTTTNVFSTAQTACITAPAAGCDFSSDPNVVAFLGANPFYQAPGKPAGFLNPAALNPVSVNYFNAGLVPVSTTGIIAPTSASTDDNNELTMRFDVQITPKDQLNVTLGGERNPTLDPFVTASNFIPWANVPGYSVTTKVNDYFLNIEYTRTISDSMLNELRFGTQRVYSLQGVPVGTNAQFTAEKLGFTNLTPDNPTGPPLIGIDGESTTFGYTYAGPSSLANNTFGISDTLTWIHGRHNWKFGVGISAYQNNQTYDFITNGVYDFDGTISGNGFADFLLGAGTDYEQGSAAPSNIRTKSTDVFAQDEWHATKRLTVTLGLRYEYNTPKSDTLGRTFSIVPGDQSTRFSNAPPGLVFPGDKGAPHGVNFPVLNNWAPRIGVAWDPFGDGKTSVRAGFGVFYDILKAEDNFQFNGQPPFFSLAGFNFPTSLSGNVGCDNSNQAGQVITYFSDPFDSVCTPNTFPSVPQLSGTAYFSQDGTLPFGVGLFFVNPHLRTPYTYQYNLSVQREIVHSLTLEVNYLGNSSHGLTTLQDANPFVLGTTDRPLNLTTGNSSCVDALGNSTSGISPDATCSFAQILEFKNIVNANYNALTASVTKQMGNTAVGNVYFTFGYSYSHNIDNGSGFRQRSQIVPSYSPELLRASSDLDVRNRVTFSGGWDLPFERTWKSAPKRLTQGWSLFPIVTWRTGFPLNVFASIPGDNGPFNEGPSGAGDEEAVNANVIGPLNTLNPKDPGNFWFNPNSFANTLNGGSPQSADTVGDCSEFATEPFGTFPSDAQAVNCPQLRTYGTFRRNSMRGPSLVNVDLSISKTTDITERVKLQIRGDFFNMLNHTEFQNPETNLQSGNFGQVLNTYDPRIIQLAMRLSF